jgi:hypothetical protein
MCVSVVEVSMGMEKEVVHVSEPLQFFRINEKQIKDVKTIVLESQNIDVEFLSHWCKLFSGINEVVERISFIGCNFLEDDGCMPDPIKYISHLTITNCKLTATQAEEVLRGLDPYCTRSIDFSQNRLGQDEKRFYEALYNYVGGGAMSLEILDLRGNGLINEFPCNECITKILF